MKIHSALVFILVCFIKGTSSAKDKKDSNYYQFWKVVHKKLVPQTKALQLSISDLLTTMCYTQEIESLLPEEVYCTEFEDYLKTTTKSLSLPQMKDTMFPNQNNRKFMKRLIKNTMKVLIQYSKPLQKILTDIKIKLNCEINPELCDKITNIGKYFNQLTDQIAIQMEAYFQIKKNKMRHSNSIEIANKSSLERLAVLYGALSQLKETENALDFIINTTWGVHIQLTTHSEFRRQRSKHRKNVNLKIQN